ncbi:hypothetical protein, partial [Serratia sp. 506_PEND]|uniref:hypothetical protein n=1 Tax=Serratia sp. 506_PEND TaxID=1572666 RepID=UPI00065FCE72
IIGFLRQGLQKVTFSWLLFAAVFWVIILVAVWWAGPLFTFHEVKPFASLWSRGLFTLGWLWLACIVMLW